MTQNPVLQLAEAVQKEIYQYYLSSPNGLLNVLFYIEVSKETFSILHNCKHTDWLSPRITLGDYKFYESMYLGNRTIVGSMYHAYTSFFVINDSLPKGKAIIRKAHAPSVSP